MDLVNEEKLEFVKDNSNMSGIVPLYSRIVIVGVEIMGRLSAQSWRFRGASPNVGGFQMRRVCLVFALNARYHACGAGRLIYRELGVYCGACISSRRFSMPTHISLMH
jgi:hypothetical protein